MRVLVTVTGRPLDLRGARYHVGERLFLDTKNAQHRMVLGAPGWVERMPTRRPQSAALDEPPVDRMVSAAVTRQATQPLKSGKHQKGH